MAIIIGFGKNLSIENEFVMCGLKLAYNPGCQGAFW